LKKILLPAVCFIFIAASIYTFYGRIDALKSQRTDIDQLSELLGKVSGVLPKKKELVYHSNGAHGEDLVLYYQGQFAIAPNIILQNREPKAGDTVLIVEKNNNDTVPIQTSNNLLTVNKDAFKVKLCVKQ
jgi:hypothetical protein